MKYFFYCILFTCLSVRGTAQENTGIRFTDSSWQQLLALAKSEHKLIFMDAHTTWCGPCKWMDKNVFPDPSVAALYNRNFINAYTDMEKGEGIALRKQYGVNAYPTYLFINGDGQVVHRAVGQSTISEFIQFGLDAISPSRNLQYLSQNYQKHFDDFDFVQVYLAALQKAYQVDKADEVALQYLQQQQPALLLSAGNWKMIKTYLNNAASPVFRYVVSHQQEFEKLYGSKEVAEKLENTYLSWPRHYIRYPEGGKIIFDQIGFDDFISQVEGSSYKGKKAIVAKSHLTVYYGLKDWTAYVKVVSGMLKEDLLPMNAKGAAELYSYANLVYRFGKEDPYAISQATGFAQKISQTIPGISGDQKASYQELYADLLDAGGKADQAALVRKNIDQKKLTEAVQNNPFQQMKIIPKKN